MRRGVRRWWVWRAIRASVAKALEQIGVGIDAAVTQERPDAPHRFAALKIDIGHYEFAPVGVRLRKNFALRSGNETRSPELQPAIAATRRGLEAKAVAGKQRQS